MEYTIENSNGETVLKNSKGLSAFQLKVIALIFMTLDHIGAIAFEVPFVMQYRSYLRTIGRLAMPIFLFLLVQSIRHTRSKKRFVLRLYLAGMGIGLFVTAMNQLFGERFNYFTPGNIIFSFFYVALYAVLIETMIKAGREKNWWTVGICVLGLAISLIPTVVYLPLLEMTYALNLDGSSRVGFLLSGLLESILPSFSSVDYGIGVIILGVAMYFAGTKKRQCVVFAIFCAVCYAGALATQVWGLYDLMQIQTYGFAMTFLDRSQLKMFWALPFMVLYNGQRGHSGKWFFYIYYPLHRELIFLLAGTFLSN